MIQYFHRHKFHPNFALEMTPGVQAWIPIGDRARWDVQGSFLAQGLWQAVDTLALRAGLNAYLRRDSRLGTAGGFSAPDFDVPTDYSWRMTFPIKTSATWSFARQWDLVADYTYQKLGEKDYESWTLGYELRHYW